MAANHAELLDEAAPATIEFKARVACMIAGRELDIGNGDWQFHNVLIDTIEPIGDIDDVRVTLAQGGDDPNEIQFDVRLIPHWQLGHQPPPEELVKHAGRWIAQRGAEIVASHETREHVVQVVRESGQRATIWRVPASKQEAEATVIDV